MDKLPNELVSMIAESLTRRELSRLSRASQTYWEQLQPLLYYKYALQGNRLTRSAVAYVMETANPNKPETRTMTLSVLEKVSQFCRLDSPVLDRCHLSTCAAAWVDSGKLCKLGFPRELWVHIAHCRSFSPLHVAALKGLDDVAAWLLDRGASVDTPPIPRSEITALILAVLGNRVSTALLLLANGADPTTGLGGSNASDPPTVLHLSCMLGLAEMADQLLTRHYPDADPAELLAFYQSNCPYDAPRLVAVLVRHGAEAAADNFRAFLRDTKWQSAWELLASPGFSDRLTAEAASCMVRDVVSLASGKLAEDVETVVCILRRLLGRGADPDLGRFLWRESGSVDYPLLLKLQDPFLEAGMDIGPSTSKRRRTGSQVPVKRGVDDILGHTSPYDQNQDEEGAAAQLSVIRVLLRYGAPIGGATRGDALDSYPRGSTEQLQGRASWSYKLCQVLLDHCHSMPGNERGEDVQLFMSRFSKVRR